MSTSQSGTISGAETQGEIDRDHTNDENDALEVKAAK
jgi:hypothetical protein